MDSAALFEDSYVDHADYNAWGQPATIDLGAAGGAKTLFTYYGDAGAQPPPGFSNLPSQRL